MLFISIILVYLGIIKNIETMTEYKTILNNLKSGVCEYGNQRTEVSYSLGITKMKIESNGDLKFFSTLEQMARNINKFLKTGY